MVGEVCPYSPSSRTDDPGRGCGSNPVVFSKPDVLKPAERQGSLLKHTVSGHCQKEGRGTAAAAPDSSLLPFRVTQEIKMPPSSQQQIRALPVQPEGGGFQPT